MDIGYIIFLVLAYIALVVMIWFIARKRRAAGEPPPVKLVLMIIMVSIVLAFIIFLPRFLLLSSTQGKARVDIVMGICFPGFWLLWWAWIGRALWARHRAGALLSDLGYDPQRKRILLSLVFLIIVVGGSALLQMSTGDGSWQSIRWGLYTILNVIPLGVFNLLNAQSKRQLLVRGIWVFPTFVPWSKIKSYEWSQDKILKIKRGSPLLDFGIPCPRTEALDALLAEHVVATPPVQQ